MNEMLTSVPTNSRSDAPCLVQRQFSLESLDEDCWAEVTRIDEQGAEGAWFVNPMFTLHAPAPDAAFFAEARARQGAFFREVSRRMGGRQWKRQRAIDQKSLSVEDFNQTYDGIFLIDTELLDNQKFEDVERRFLRKCLVLPVPKAYRALRKENLSLFSYVQEDLQKLKSEPTAVWFLIPSCIVLAGEMTPEFEAECQNRWREWDGKIRWLLRQNQITPKFAAEIRKLRFSSEESLRVGHCNS
jgi:hypothetical protein